MYDQRVYGAKRPSRCEVYGTCCPQNLARSHLYTSCVCVFRRGTFVRLGFANVDRSFVEIDLERKFLATPEPAPAISR